MNNTNCLLECNDNYINYCSLNNIILYTISITNMVFTYFITKKVYSLSQRKTYEQLSSSSSPPAYQ